MSETPRAVDSQPAATTSSATQTGSPVVATANGNGADTARGTAGHSSADTARGGAGGTGVDRPGTTPETGAAMHTSPSDEPGAAPEKTHRIPLYGAGVAVIALLCWLGFVYPKNVLPDPGTLFSIAELHLGMAQLIPDEKDEGRRIREEHLVKARDALAKLERKAPGLAITREMQGFASWIEGNWDESLAWYEKAMQASTSNASYHDRLAIKRAQVLFAADRADEARKALVAIDEAGRDAEWHLLDASMQNRAGNAEARSAALTRAFQVAEGDEKMRHTVAHTSFQMSDATACSQYESLEQKDAVVWYRIARLKISQGEIDRGRDALTTVREMDPKLLDKLIEADQGFWTPDRKSAVFTHAPAATSSEAGQGQERK